MPATLLFVHGRSQESSDEVARDPARLAAYVEAKKRGWLGGLAKGLIAAGLPAVDPGTVLFPFYGNRVAETIAKFEAGGGRRPMLEDTADDATGDQAALAEAKGEVLLDVAASLGFDPARELAYYDPEAARAAAREEAFGFGSLLRVPVLRAALQFVGRKTGTPSIIIEQFLTDVAYYLKVPAVRDVVLDVVLGELRSRLPGGGDVVVVAHSLGTVVAYDALSRLPAAYRIRQLVTAGSPLGYPVVQRHLLGARRDGPPPVPAALPVSRGAWVNAYDVADFVCLIHPLAGRFTEAAGGQLRDERTHNAGGPHAIEDYLADPDVAGPVGRALT
jgi:hypothetical protein